MKEWRNVLIRLLFYIIYDCCDVMRKFVSFSIPFCFLLMFSSCYYKNTKADVHKLSGVQMKFPSTITSVCNDEVIDSTLWNHKELLMIYWIDSTVCTSCQMKSLYKWEDICDYCNADSNSVDFAFIFTPKAKDLQLFREFVKRNNFIPALTYIDSEFSFQEQNEALKAKSKFNVFLLNQDNRILLVGNPVNNQKLWKLYQETINQFSQNTTTK